MVKSSGHSSRGGFPSQNPHGGSQPFGTPVTSDLIPSFGRCGHQAWDADIHAEETNNNNMHLEVSSRTLA